MFITIIDASKGKPYSLTEPLNEGRAIAIRSLTLNVGWYNIPEDQTWEWARTTEDSTEVNLEAGLYSFQELVDHLTGVIDGFTITVNESNGKINMIIPAGITIRLTEQISYLLGLDDTGWLEDGEYVGDRAVEFLPKRILIYLKQLSTTNNVANDDRDCSLSASQLLAVVPVRDKSFGESYSINFEKPMFKQLSSGSAISEIDLDFKIQWGNGVKHKLDNHDQPIDVVLEIK